MDYEFFNLKSYCLFNDCATAGHINCYVSNNLEFLTFNW